MDTYSCSIYFFILLAICNALELLFIHLFLTVLGLSVRACRQRGLLPSCSAQAPPCCDLSGCRAQALGTWA